MIFTEDFFSFLKKKKIDFFSGVPDSILKSTSNFFDKKSKYKHIIAANEGAAVSISIGNYLSTKKIPCVYLQNSGLGNAINPLISIAHKKVYSIPLLLVIGWRGSPGSIDEPQHIAKGKITKQILKLLGIKNCVLRQKKDFKKLNNLINYSKKMKIPVACLIEKNILVTKKNYTKHLKKNRGLLRNQFIKELLQCIDLKTKIISTTGYTSRELFQIRSLHALKKGIDFYMVGGMGHSSMVSLGVSLRTKSQVICLDGDGSMLMHMGSVRTVGMFANNNFKHILLNNNAHESVGGQPTFAKNLNFQKLIFSLGYKNYYKLTKKKNLKVTLKKFLKSRGPSFLEILTKTGSIQPLSRPKKFNIIKRRFMQQ